MTLLGFALPLTAAWLLLGALRRGGLHAPPLVRAGLSIALGAGLSSIVAFLWVAAGIDLDGRFVVADLCWWSAATIGAWWWHRRSAPVAAPPWQAPDESPDPLRWIARAVFALVAILVAANVVSQFIASPHGQWDAWAIWNQKARFLARDVGHWTDMQAIPWANPGHPFLVSLSVARLWTYAGAEITLAPAALSAIWAMAVVALLIGAVGANRWQGWTAGALVASPGMFADLASAQTADLPLSMFLLASLVMVRQAVTTTEPSSSRRALVMAAVLTGLAAFTKNEGLVLAVAATAVLAATLWGQRRPREVVWWIGGALPLGACIAWYKLALAPVPPEYLTEAGGPAALIARFLDLDRHRLIAPVVWEHWLNWGGPNASGLLPLTMAAAIGSAGLGRRTGTRPLLAIVAMMAASYYGIWVVSALDIQWLVRTTFDRLMLQIWPTLVLVIFTGPLCAGPGRVRRQPDPPAATALPA
jgi:hypothetical protein